MFCKVLRYASQHDSTVWKFRESTTITPNTINMILFDWFVFFLLFIFSMIINLGGNSKLKIILIKRVSF